MSYPPNKQVQNWNQYQGGPGYNQPGYLVTNGQHAYNWATSLGGTFVLENQNKSWRLVMPFLQDGTPTPIPFELQAMLTNYKESVLAAIQDIAYPPLPPNTNVPPPECL